MLFSIEVIIQTTKVFSSLTLPAILENNFYVSAQPTSESDIVFVLSQYDGGIIEQRTIGYVCRQNLEAKLKDCGRSNSLIQPTRTSSYMTSLIVP